MHQQLDVLLPALVDHSRHGRGYAIFAVRGPIPIILTLVLPAVEIGVMTTTLHTELQARVTSNDSYTLATRHVSLVLRTMCGSRTGGWSLPWVMSD
jgi:hypothetical protein